MSLLSFYRNRLVFQCWISLKIPIFYKVFSILLDQNLPKSSIHCFYALWNQVKFTDSSMKPGVTILSILMDYKWLQTPALKWLSQLHSMVGLRTIPSLIFYKSSQIASSMYWQPVKISLGYVDFLILWNRIYIYFFSQSCKHFRRKIV